MEYLTAIGKFIGEYGLSTMMVGVSFWACLFRFSPWLARRVDFVGKIMLRMVRRTMNEHITFLRELRGAFAEQRDHRHEVKEHIVVASRSARQTQRAISHIGDAIVVVAPDEEKRNAAEELIDRAKRSFETE